MKAILYIAHGTRSKKGANEAKAFLERVIEKVSVPIQEMSFLELTDPSIETGFKQCVEKGATEITVVPIFLLAAGHIKKDIPNLLQSLCVQYPNIAVELRDPFGVQDDILDAIHERVVKEAGVLTAQDSLLIVGRGSSDPSILESFSFIQTGIQTRCNTDQVSVCYLAAAEPRFKEGLQAALNRATGRLIVVPYLLFSGLLLNEMDQAIRKHPSVIRIAPLSRHRAVEDLVLKRITSEHIV